MPYEYQLQQKLIEMNCYIDSMVPCDEIKLSNEVVDDTIKLLKAKEELKLDTEYLDYIKVELRKNNPLSANPGYPLFSMKPSKLAKITTTGIKTSMPKLVLRSLKVSTEKVNKDNYKYLGR